MSDKNWEAWEEEDHFEKKKKMPHSSSFKHEDEFQKKQGFKKRTGKKFFPIKNKSFK